MLRPNNVEAERMLHFVHVYRNLKSPGAPLCRDRVSEMGLAGLVADRQWVVLIVVHSEL